MIRWLVESFEAESKLKYGLVPDGMLASRERAQLDELHNAKRRREWLLGRWTAKRLLQETLKPVLGRMPEMSEVAIYNGPLGAPYAILDKRKGGEIPFHITISHSGRRALCAIVEKHEGWIGADIEHVEARSHGFAEEYFSDDEQKFLKSIPWRERTLYTNAIWSAKEAVLKALRLGLRLDTRRVSCGLTQLRNGEQEWKHFEVEFHLDELDPSLPVRPVYPASVVGWWQVFHNYVLSMAIYRPGAALEKPGANLSRHSYVRIAPQQVDHRG